MAEMPCHSDTTNIEAQYARRMSNNFSFVGNAIQHDVSKVNYGGKTMNKCKHGFPFKVPQLVEELDEDCICYL